LSVEIDAALAIKSDIAEYGTLVSTPGEHRQRHRDGNIDTNLANLDFILKFTSSCSRLGKDGGSITVPVIVDDFDGVIQSIRFQDYENRTKDLLAVCIWI
jgi:hypothetical protein